MGLTWKDLGSIENAEEFLNQSGDALLRLIKKEKEYVADFSISEGMFIGQPFAIPLSKKIDLRQRYCTCRL